MARGRSTPTVPIPDDIPDNVVEVAVAEEQTGNVERMPSCNLDSARDRLVLCREVASMLNSGGGTILIGVKKGGQPAGLRPEQATELEPDVVTKLINDHLTPDQVELAVTTTTGDDGVIVEISVPAIPDPPVVLARAGTYIDAADDEQSVFGAQSVFVRHNNRTVVAGREDYLRWRADAVDDVRRGLNERLAMVVAAPPEARIRVVTSEEVRDEPSYFLSRSTELFGLQNDQLLSNQDLLYLWLHRSTLQIDDAAAELLVQSALRRRATLYLWLSVLPIGPAEIRRFLERAVDMKDRDKSDAARAMLFVCALYLEPDDYVKLAAALEASSYAHMREAAETLPDIEQAKAQLKGERLIGSGQGQLVHEPDFELFRQVDELLERTGPGSRRVPSLGLELLCRKLERRNADLLE